MSYQEKVDVVLNVVREHNDAVGEGNPGIVDFEAFLKNIKACGGTTEVLLAKMSHEDILNCMPVTGSIKPRILAQSIADIFRDKKDSLEKRPIASKKAEKMTPRELVESFDPEDSTNSVGRRLSEISKNQSFIVYSSGRNIDTESTLKLLLEIKSGFSGREDFDVNGTIKKVYKIGELPENYVDENPLYPGRPLRPDGTCDQTGRSWDGVPLNLRQVVRLAINERELEVNIENAHNILDIVMSSDAAIKLFKRYRKTALAFDKLSGTGDLPKLKMELSQKFHSLRDGRKVNW